MYDLSAQGCRAFGNFARCALAENRHATGVGRGELASVEERQPHGAEIIRRHAVVEHGPGFPAFELESADAEHIIDRKAVGGGSGFDAGHSAQAVQRVAIIIGFSCFRLLAGSGQ